MPDDVAIAAQMEEFFSASGYTVYDLAEAIGYSRTAVSLMRDGKYCEHHKREGNTLAVRAAIKEFIESFEAPEFESAATQIYRTGNFEKIKKAFDQALNNGWAYCVDGAPGTQKTYAAKYLINQLHKEEAGKNGHGRRAVYVYCRQGIRPQDLLRRIAMAAGVPTRGMIDNLIKKIHFHFARRRVLLILDEAQHLSVECVETVRELLDLPPHFGLLFIGSHDLQKTFQHFAMEQWRSRLNRVIVLPGIEREEAVKIITDQLGERPQKKIDELIAGASVIDHRQTPQTKYISARNLFKTIDLVKRAEGAKEAAHA